MKEVYKKNKIKAIVAFAVALAFVMPVAAVANVIGEPNNISSSDVDIDLQTLDNSDNTGDTVATLGTIYVGSGPGNDSTTIQGGVNLAGPGETVYVYDGTYNERVTVNKQLDLVGESREGVIVDGGGSGRVFSVTADYVSIDSFTLTNAGGGIHVGEELSNCDILNCNIYGISGTAINFEASSDNTITNCHLYDNSYSGIYCYMSSNNYITDCTIDNCNMGLFIVDDSYDCTITGCSVINNGYGVLMEGCSEGHLIYHSNFVNNEEYYDDCGNTWDNGYPSGGNYWDIYDGVDVCSGPGQNEPGSDGIGDTPFDYEGIFDGYPLMIPLGQPEMSILPATQTVEKGDSFTVDVYIDTKDYSITGVNVDLLSFDPSVIQADLVTFKDFFGSADVFRLSGTINNGAGTITGIVEASIPYAPTSKAGTWITIDFTALEYGTSPITMDVVGLGNETGQPIDPIGVINGEVIVSTFYDLDISVDGLGTTDPLPGIHSYVAGETVGLEAIPDLGWSFDHWTGDVANPNSATTTITMNDNESVTAYFIEDEYTLIVTPDGNGHVDVDPLETFYRYGDEPQLTAVADDGWTFDHWSGDLSGNTNPTTIFMDGNKAVTAHFTWDEYTLIVTPDGNGHVDVDPLETFYRYGDEPQLTAVADQGWSFDHWSGDLSGNTNPTTIFMDGNKAVTATFTEDQYTLDITIVGGGDVTKNPDQSTYTYGTVVELTATADYGWEFEGWSGPDAGEINVDDEITMTKDMEVTATFKQTGWDATLTISGTVSLTTEDTVVFGEKELADNGIDIYDLPKSPTPPDAPYVYAWFNTSLAVPYDFLWEDYRHLGDENTWNLKVLTDGDLERVWVTIAWAPVDVSSVYDYVGLYDMLTENCVVPDMRIVGTYSYWADNGMEYWFQIRSGMNHPLFANDDNYETNENTVLVVDAPGVLGNDIDPDGDDIWVDSMDTTSTLGGSITWVDDGSFVYTPPVGEGGVTDSFTYVATDGEYYSSATVYIEIIALNRISIEDGWNLFSIPIGENIDKTTIIVEYGSPLEWHTWAEALSDGVILKFTYGWQAGCYTDGKGNTLEPGEGYWMWAFEDCDLLIPSNAPTDNHITYLDDGWNLVGVHEDDLIKTQLRVQYDGEYRLWTYAVTHGVILDFVYDWDRTNQNYALSDIFVSSYGYWVYAYQGCALKEPL